MNNVKLEHAVRFVTRPLSISVLIYVVIQVHLLKSFFTGIRLPGDDAADGKISDAFADRLYTKISSASDYDHSTIHVETWRCIHFQRA